MSLTDAPQWLVPAFVRSAAAVGATAGRDEIKRTATGLLARWQEPERRFHNLRHLIDVLARVDELAEETHVPDVVRLAAWYHGAVFNSSTHEAYAGRGGEDEVASAALAREELTALGVPTAVTERVHSLITGLARHDADERDVDALALCDADLGTLAVEPQRYAQYRKAIREEYADIPEQDYVSSRIAILTRLLQRRRLFVSPFSLAWEEPARENLTAELGHLRSRLAALGGTEPAAQPARPHSGTATSWPRQEPAVPAAAGDRQHADRGPQPDDVTPAAAPSDPVVSPVRPSPADPPLPPPAAPATPVSAPSAGGADSLSGIEREPDLERRRRARRKRRERAAAQGQDGPEPSPSALFRPPPTLPRS